MDSLKELKKKELKPYKWKIKDQKKKQWNEEIKET